jgi:hypothetical protein
LVAFERALKEEKIPLSGAPKLFDKVRDSKNLVGLRKATGGPSPAALQEHVSLLDRSKESLFKWVSAKRKKISAAELLLRKQEKAL